jgi:hypothetical protein
MIRCLHCMDNNIYVDYTITQYSTINNTTQHMAPFPTEEKRLHATFTHRKRETEISVDAILITVHCTPYTVTPHKL